MDKVHRIRIYDVLIHHVLKMPNLMLEAPRCILLILCKCHIFEIELDSGLCFELKGLESQQMYTNSAIIEGQKLNNLQYEALSIPLDV